MKKAIYLVLTLCLVFSLTACAGKASIVGTWKYTMDYNKLMESMSEEEGTDAEDEDMKGLVDAMNKLFEGLTMVIVLDLKEDNTFTMSTDEASMKAANELIKERMPEFLKTMGSILEKASIISSSSSLASMAVTFSSLAESSTVMVAASSPSGVRTSLPSA